MKKVLTWLFCLLTVFSFNLALAEELTIEVFKSPYCGCCDKWITHLEENGFRVTARVMENMDSVKAKLKIAAELQSCHTGLIGGYFVEGHVPADDIKRLLIERPTIDGLTVPGMPAGTNVPGMETTSVKATFDVLSVQGNVIRIYRRYE